MSSRGGVIFRLQLLGPFRLEPDDGKRILHIANKKARALIAYLAMQPDHAAPRERLSGLLWGNRSDVDARHSLRQCLVTLRKELEPFADDLIEVSRDRIGLRSGRINVDARQMTAFASGKTDADLDRAMALCAGEFLEGLVLGEAFDDWALEQRARLEEISSGIYEAAAARWDNPSSGLKAVAAAERLIAINPLREDWQRIAMRTFAHHCGRDHALAHARELVSLLTRDLNEGPDPETIELIRKIHSRELGRMSAPDMPVPKELAALGASDAPALVPAVMSETPEEVPSAPLPAEPPSVAAKPDAVPMQHPGAAMAHVRRHLVAYVAVAAAILGAVVTLTVSEMLRDRMQATASNVKSFVLNQALGQPAGPSLLMMPFTVAPDMPQADRRHVQALQNVVAEHVAQLPIARVVPPDERRGGNLLRWAAELVDKPYRLRANLWSDNGAAMLSVNLSEPNGRQVWRDKIRLEPTGLRDADIAKRIGRAIEVSLVKSEARRNSEDDDVRALLLSARAAQLRGNSSASAAGAMALYEEALRLEPDSPDALTGVAGQLLSSRAQLLAPDAKDLDRAEELLRLALGLDSENFRAHFFMGMLHKHRGDAADAIRSFRRALDINPSFAPAYANIGHALALQGKFEEGLTQLTYAMRISPRDSYLDVWYAFAGEIEFERGRVAAAIEWFQQAVTRSPDFARANGGLAVAYLELLDHAKARRYLNEFRALLPEESVDTLLGRLRSAAQDNAASHPSKFYNAIRTALQASS